MNQNFKVDELQFISVHFVVELSRYMTVCSMVDVIVALQH